MKEMSIFRKTFLLVGLAVLATGCAPVQERQAVQVWQQESVRRDEGRVSLPELGEKTTLDEYARYAVLNNPGLRAAFARWKATLDRVAPARTLSDPRFTYGYFVREVETRVGAQRQRFGLAQTFPWIGKLDLRGRMALQAAEVEQRRFEAARNELVYRVKTAYYELYYLHRAIEVTESNVQLLAYLEEVARAQYRGGAGRHGAVVKVQVELGKLEERLRELRDMGRPLRAKLNAALGRPAGASVAVTSTLPAESIDIADEDLVSLLRARNPGLKAVEAAAAREELAIELAGKNSFPDLSLGVDYIATGKAEAAGMVPPPDSGKDPVVAMASINLPIWRDKYRAQEREARARHRAVLQQRKEKENQLIAALELALYGRRDGDRKIELYRDALVPKAEQAVGVAQQAFAAGKGDFLDLIDAQRVLLEFQLAHERARTHRAGRLAEVEMLIGGGALAAGSDTTSAD